MQRGENDVLAPTTISRMVYGAKISRAIPGNVGPSFVAVSFVVVTLFLVVGEDAGGRSATPVLATFGSGGGRGPPETIPRN